MIDTSSLEVLKTAKSIPASFAVLSYSGVFDTITGTPHTMLVIILLLLVHLSMSEPSCIRQLRWQPRRMSVIPSLVQATNSIPGYFFAYSSYPVEATTTFVSGRAVMISAYFSNRAMFPKLPNHRTLRGDSAGEPLHSTPEG